MEFSKEEGQIKKNHKESQSLSNSKISSLDNELSKLLEKAFYSFESTEIDFEELKKIVNAHNPIDLAYVASYLPPFFRSVLYQYLPSISSKTLFIINTDSASRWAIFRYLENSQISILMEHMPPDEAVWVLDDVSDRRYRKILELMNSKKASKIKELQKHARNTAGRLMTNEFFSFSLETTVEEVAKCIGNNPGIELTRRIFVLDNTGKLLGFVSARNLIIKPSNSILSEIMYKIEYKVVPESTREEIVDIVERYKIPALPVVDDVGFLLGIITYEDVVEAIEDIADETIARIAGTREEFGYNNYRVVTRFLSRAPWLLATLLVGLCNATIMAFFQKIASNLLALIIFFIPLINGMSGNVGIQCSTILVRSMATGCFYGHKKDTIIKEFLIGSLIGTALGILCGILVYLMMFFKIADFKGNSLQLGVTVAAGVLGASLTATTLGVFSPFFFAKIKVDPAIASGPIVTAFNDIFSMVMFFVISCVIQIIFIKI